MRRLAYVVALLLLCPGVASALICATDSVPAATLLLPYFEVDPRDPNGIQTLLSINNASATAVLVHVVIWSDLSVPVLDFNVYLTGYDVQTINLRDIIVNGNMPQTASAGQDPNDTISPQGPKSQDINFASCQGQLPPPHLPPLYLQHLQLALSGQASPLFGGLCAGQRLGDNIARGYVTADTVNNCTLRLPSDPAYFTSDITDQNVLWGDYIFDNTNNGVAYGSTLVAIEASATDPATSTPGRYTFYGRYDGWSAIDHREPLATHFAVRYLEGGGFGAGTDLLVWRDSKVSQNPFTCPVSAGARPLWYPLGQEEIVIFDEQENPVVPTTFPFSPQPPQATLLGFPAEAQRVTVGPATLPVVSPFGWLYLDLNTTVAAAGANPPVDPGAAQAWVAAVMTSNGHYSVGADATRLDSACQASHSQI